jgi:hypothetical protein
MEYSSHEAGRKGGSREKRDEREKRRDNTEREATEREEIGQRSDKTENEYTETEERRDIITVLVKKILLFKVQRCSIVITSHNPRN